MTAKREAVVLLWDPHGPRFDMLLPEMPDADALERDEFDARMMVGERRPWLLLNANPCRRLTPRVNERLYYAVLDRDELTRGEG